MLKPETDIILWDFHIIKWNYPVIPWKLHAFTWSFSCYNVKPSHYFVFLLLLLPFYHVIQEMKFLLELFFSSNNLHLPASLPQPRKDSRLFPLLVVSRVAFVPLLMLCNVQSRSYLPVYFQHDAAFTTIMALFSFSSGYFMCLSMSYAPQWVPTWYKIHIYLFDIFCPSCT